MEDQPAVLANTQNQDLFEPAMRGYNKRQVNEHVAHTQTQVRDLEQRLARAVDAAEQAQLELAAVREQSSGRPAHEEVSDRLSQILRLAAEEAEQARSKAEGDIEQMRQTAEQEIGTLVQDARDEAEEIISRARAESDHTLAGAREESQQLLDGSRAEAERVVAEATDHAERLRRQAEQRSSVVNGVLTERVSALDRAHLEAVRRLDEIGQTIGGLLRAEAEAGPLEPGLPPVSDPGPVSGGQQYGSEIGRTPLAPEEPVGESVTVTVEPLGDDPGTSPSSSSDDIVIDLTTTEPTHTGRYS